MDKTDVLWVTTPHFVPFREDNLLPKRSTSFKITDPTIKISSASAFYPATAGVCENLFLKENFVERESLNKVNNLIGFDALAKGKIDAFISFSGEEQIAELRQAVPGLKTFVLLYDPLAIFVNKENPVTHLTSAQLKNIYAGKIKNWSEVGGHDSIIHTYELTPGANVSRAAFDEIMSSHSYDDTHQEIESMPDLVDKTAEDATALSNIFWSYYAKMYANKNTRMISIDGKKPTDADYPFRFPIYIFYDGDSKKEQLHQLTSYLDTDEGRQLIAEANKCLRTVE